jgi:cytochrome c oxidase assembly protein subunit 15
MGRPMRKRLASITITPSAYAVLALSAFAILVLIVFSGAAVRTTGSGLGCPDWPDCKGTFLPAPDTAAWIEYSNRLLSTVVGIVCVAAGVLVYRRRPFRRDLVRPAMVLPVGVVAEGALGAAAVGLDLSWPVVIAHYLLSLVLLLAATVLVWRMRREEGAPRPAGDLVAVIATRVLVAYGAVIIVLGTLTTAAGPHAGGARTGDVVERLDAFGVHTFRSLIHLHGHLAAVMGFTAIAVWALAWRRGAGQELRRALTGVCLLLGLQGVVGLIQYYNDLPAAVVWVHASLPAMLWALLVWSWLAAGKPLPASAPRTTLRLREERGARDAGPDVVVPADAAASVPPGRAPVR